MTLERYLETLALPAHRTLTCPGLLDYACVCAKHPDKGTTPLAPLCGVRFVRQVLCLKTLATHVLPSIVQAALGEAGHKASGASPRPGSSRNSPLRRRALFPP